MHPDVWISTVVAERDAALAELAGLSADHLEANRDLLGREQRVTALYEELKAWRACAERLAAVERCWRPDRRTGWPCGKCKACDAFAEYEALKGGDR